MASQASRVAELKAQEAIATARELWDTTAKALGGGIPHFIIPISLIVSHSPTCRSNKQRHQGSKLRARHTGRNREPATRGNPKPDADCVALCCDSGRELGCRRSSIITAKFVGRPERRSSAAASSTRGSQSGGHGVTWPRADWRLTMTRT